MLKLVEKQKEIDRSSIAWAEVVSTRRFIRFSNASSDVGCVRSLCVTPILARKNTHVYSFLKS
jgi:hypothetical protein